MLVRFKDWRTVVSAYIIIIIVILIIIVIIITIVIIGQPTSEGKGITLNFYS